MRKKDRTVHPEFRSMETQDLAEMLRTELGKECPDRDVALGILNILEERDTKAPLREDIDVDAVWKKFLARREQYSAAVEACVPKKRPRRWIPKAAVAAVLVVVLLLVAPPVLGAENIFELVGRWTQDIFMLIDPAATVTQPQEEYVFKTDHPGLQQLYDTVAEQGITQPIVPMWVPEECVLDELEVTTTPKGNRILASLICDDEYILITYKAYKDETYNKYPVDDDKEKIYELTGTKHYITSNEDVWTVVWSTDGISCSIITTYNEESFYRILDSIYVEEA